MAKRRKTAPLTPAAPSARKPAVQRLDSLPHPNPTSLLFLWPEDYLAGQPSLAAVRQFKLMSLLADPNANDGVASLLFVDPRYQLTRWSPRADCPPSWMDPEVFIRQVLQDGRCRQIVAAYLKNQDAGNRRALRQLLLSLFQTTYRQYLEEQFAKALPTLAHWLTAYLADKQLHGETPLRPPARPPASTAAASAPKLPTPGSLAKQPAKRLSGSPAASRAGAKTHIKR